MLPQLPRPPWLAPPLPARTGAASVAVMHIFCGSSLIVLGLAHTGRPRPAPAVRHAACFSRASTRFGAIPQQQAGLPTRNRQRQQVFEEDRARCPGRVMGSVVPRAIAGRPSTARTSRATSTSPTSRFPRPARRSCASRAAIHPSHAPAAISHDTTAKAADARGGRSLGGAPPSQSWKP